MRAKVEICYGDGTRNKEVVVELSGKPKGTRIMTAVEKAVEKAMSKDIDWTGWNLLDLCSFVCTGDACITFICESHLLTRP